MTDDDTPPDPDPDPDPDPREYAFRRDEEWWKDLWALTAAIGYIAATDGNDNPYLALGVIILPIFLLLVGQTAVYLFLRWGETKP